MCSSRDPNAHMPSQIIDQIIERLVNPVTVLLRLSVMHDATTPYVRVGRTTAYPCRCFDLISNKDCVFQSFCWVQREQHPAARFHLVARRQQRQWSLATSGCTIIYVRVYVCAGITVSLPLFDNLNNKTKRLRVESLEGSNTRALQSNIWRRW